MRISAARIMAGIADKKVRRRNYDRAVVLIYGTGHRLCSMERIRLKRYRK